MFRGQRFYLLIMFITLGAVSCADTGPSTLKGDDNLFASYQELSGQPVGGYETRVISESEFDASYDSEKNRYIQLTSAQVSAIKENSSAEIFLSNSLPTRVDLVFPGSARSLSTSFGVSSSALSGAFTEIQTVFIVPEKVDRPWLLEINPSSNSSAGLSGLAQGVLEEITSIYLYF